MANDIRATLEAQRIEALHKGDALTYRSISDTLGYTRLALEDPNLYDSVSGAQQSQGVEFVRRKVSNVQDLEDSDLRAISLILESFVGREPRNNLKRNMEITRRLQKISRIGYPLPDISGFNGAQILDLYSSVKDSVLREKRHRRIR